MSEEFKPVVFTRHARERCTQWGTTEEDVIVAIRSGKREAAQRGLWQYQREWGGVWYAVQQVAPVVEEDEGRFVVVTVYTYYFCICLPV